MSKPPQYEEYPQPKNGDPVDRYQEMQNWQAKRAEMLRDWLTTGAWYVGGGVLTLVLVAAAVFGCWKWLTYSQDLYGRGYRAWAGQCEAAGGRPAGPYSNADAQICVFPNGAQLTRTIPV